ncbi:MAG: hypothetical protein IJ083_07600 [Clostridia bacterium]|nr:hypothetical protein [Clostridia bacterium]
MAVNAGIRGRSSRLANSAGRFSGVFRREKSNWGYMEEPHASGPRITCSVVFPEVSPSMDPVYTASGGLGYRMEEKRRRQMEEREHREKPVSKKGLDRWILHLVLFAILAVTLVIMVSTGLRIFSEMREIDNMNTRYQVRSADCERLNAELKDTREQMRVSLAAVDLGMISSKDQGETELTVPSSVRSLPKDLEGLMP